MLTRSRADGIEIDGRIETHTDARRTAQARVVDTNPEASETVRVVGPRIFENMSAASGAGPTSRILGQDRSWPAGKANTLKASEGRVAADSPNHYEAREHAKRLFG